MSAASYQQLLVKCPWYESWKSAKRRCSDVKHKSYPRYGGRGIKFNLTKGEVMSLWLRDQAIFMDRPRLNRLNVDGDYCFDNCRFIPELENIARRYDNDAAPSDWSD